MCLDSNINAQISTRPTVPLSLSILQKHESKGASPGFQRCRAIWVGSFLMFLHTHTNYSFSTGLLCSQSWKINRVGSSQPCFPASCLIQDYTANTLAFSSKQPLFPASSSLQQTSFLFSGPSQSSALVPPKKFLSKPHHCFQIPQYFLEANKVYF